MILINAAIHTMDPARPRAEALAVTAGRISAMGSTATIRALAGPQTRVIDAGGRLVLPGFQDAHVHLLDGGISLVHDAPLWDVTSEAELLAVMAAHAAGSDAALVVGAGWQAGIFGDHNLTRDVLDRAVPDRPCMVLDSSFHNACLNSVACDLLGLAPGIDDPPNGHVVRDAAGRPTGMLHEDAVIWAEARLPGLTDATRMAGLRAGQAHANRHGITGIIDPKVVDYHARIYGALAAEGGLTLRVAGAASVTPADTAETALARLTDLRAAHPGPDFHINAAKFFFDGVLENRTAAMLAPYADALGGNAPVMFAPAQIAALFIALDAVRLQIHVHVIGDAAARAALDGLELARNTNGPWPALHQLAHLQMIDPADSARLQALGAMANIQPLWARYDPVVPDEWLALVGPARAPNVYAFRRMLNHGAGWCLSSDWPVTTLNPFEIIETAVTRQPPGAVTPAFFPAECLTVAEAIHGYTIGAAQACWRADHTGMLRPGFSADLIVLDRDLFTCAPQAISQTQVLLTLFKGGEVHRAPDFCG
nr:amidohydrolase [Fertoeibacter niger]